MLPVSLSRGVRRRSFTILTPFNHYPSRLPNLPDTTVVKLVTPRLAPARFSEYLVTMDARARTTTPVEEDLESFLYGLDGKARLECDDLQASLGPGAFAYLPPARPFELRNGAQAARFLWLKRRYEPWPGLDEPPALGGHRDDAPFEETEVPALVRRELLPADDARFDFTMSLLGFEAGVALANVEIHDEEHGLYMTNGGGLYHLDGEQHEVHAGDFIYMAPYCPQSFVAIGPGSSEYLLYKDANRG